MLTSFACVPSRYEGNFKDDKRHGSGTCEYANGDIYEGEWRNDQRSGRGLMLLANGDRFEGTFRGDKKNGAGKYYYRDTRKMYEGEWIEDIAKCGVRHRTMTPSAPPSSAYIKISFIHIPHTFSRTPLYIRTRESRTRQPQLANVTHVHFSFFCRCIRIYPQSSGAQLEPKRS